MIKPVVKNLPQVFMELDAWEKAVTELIEGVARGLGTEAFVRILDYSPKYSGDFAAQWKLSVGEIQPSFRAGVLGKYYPDEDPYIAGDRPAIDYAVTNAIGKWNSFKLGQTLWIHNSAEHLTTYAWKIEGNMIKFRPGNEGGTIGRTMDEMRVAYANISKAEAINLAQNKI